MYKTNYWYLRKMLCQRVLFDEANWKQCAPKIEQFWVEVMKMREDRSNAPVPVQPPLKKYTFLDSSDDDA